jgi:hypothetical protein
MSVYTQITYTYMLYDPKETCLTKAWHSYDHAYNIRMSIFMYSDPAFRCRMNGVSTITTVEYTLIHRCALIHRCMCIVTVSVTFTVIIMLHIPFGTTIHMSIDIMMLPFHRWNLVFLYHAAHAMLTWFYPAYTST